MKHTYISPVVWTLNVKCHDNAPPSIVRVVKDKTIEQLLESIVEQVSEYEFHDIEYIKHYNFFKNYFLITTIILLHTPSNIHYLLLYML